MKRLSTFSFLLLTLLLFATPSMSRIDIDIGTAPMKAPIAQPNSVATQAAALEALQSAPVMFIENVGQFDDDARFHVRGGNYDLWVASDALWITLLEAAPPQSPPILGGKPEAHLRQNNETSAELSRTLDEPRQGVNLKLSFVDANPQPEIEPFNLLETMASTSWATTKTNGARTYPFGAACATKRSIRALIWN